MKVGISLSIDVTKIDKARIFKGKKGSYIDLTTFVDIDVKDKFDNNGFVTHSLTKEEREAKVQLPIIGNVKVFYSDGNSQPQQNTGQNGGYQQNNAQQDDGDSIPF